MFPFTPNRQRASRRNRRAELRLIKTSLTEQRDRLGAARRALTAAAAARAESAADLSNAHRRSVHRKALLAAMVVPVLMLAGGHLLFAVMAPVLGSTAIYWTLTGPTYVLAAAVSVVLTVVGVRAAVLFRRDITSWEVAAAVDADMYDDASAKVTELEQQVRVTAADLRARKRR
ncbi:hypothetical protein ACWGJ9_11670 [Curtobacterium citreum]